MVYNDLNESIYVYDNGKLKFYFSSSFYLSKFIKEYPDFLKNETMKLKVKFRCNVEADEMIMLLLYKRIEKRGFKVLKDNVELNNYNIVLQIK